MNIYVDLDETLIHAIPGYSGNPGKRTPIKIPNIDCKENSYELYYSLLRPNAHRLLNFCRYLTNVKMLTTATRDYALLHNEAFSLGFSESDVIAREDYLIKTTLAYGSSIETIAAQTDPKSLLIDNLPPNADAAKLKQQFLGIREENYVQIRDFNGKDPEIFENELGEIFLKLQNTLKSHNKDLIKVGPVNNKREKETVGITIS